MLGPGVIHRNQKLVLEGIRKSPELVQNFLGLTGIRMGLKLEVNYKSSELVPGVIHRNLGLGLNFHKLKVIQTWMKGKLKIHRLTVILILIQNTGDTRRLADKSGLHTPP